LASGPQRGGGVRRLVSLLESALFVLYVPFVLLK
jgi:hypothetical protein